MHGHGSESKSKHDQGVELKAEYSHSSKAKDDEGPMAYNNAKSNKVKSDKFSKANKTKSKMRE